MGEVAVAGAMMMCSFGLAPSALGVLPASGTTVQGRPLADVTNTVTGVNIPPFGMCSSLANPAVAAATSAALGVLTPMPCTPLVTAPWAPGAPTTLVRGKPALTGESKALCAYGGVITMTAPGSVGVTAQ